MLGFQLLEQYTGWLKTQTGLITILGPGDANCKAVLQSLWVYFLCTHSGKRVGRGYLCLSSLYVQFLVFIHLSFIYSLDLGRVHTCCRVCVVTRGQLAAVTGVIFLPLLCRIKLRLSGLKQAPLPAEAVSSTLPFHYRTLIALENPTSRSVLHLTLNIFQDD